MNGSGKIAWICIGIFEELCKQTYQSAVHSDKNKNTNTYTPVYIQNNYFLYLNVRSRHYTSPCLPLCPFSLSFSLSSSQPFHHFPSISSSLPYHPLFLSPPFSLSSAPSLDFLSNPLPFPPSIFPSLNFLSPPLPSLPIPSFPHSDAMGGGH